ncbi:hypothetical protein M0R45_013765 [Rubus argutus]|uniref:Endonuclease/exonuclease/phosphatase domain-containing protein n=1 Tax=Rubus argutus TaxID=59490 RepID=A0AAW1XJB7_RUBAR
MKLIFWNARGIANDGTQRALKNMVLSHIPNIVCLSEPLVLPSSIPVAFWRSLGLSLLTTNDRGTQIPNIWFLCHLDLKPTVVSSTAQQITVTCLLNGTLCTLTTVYAKTTIAG